MPSSLLEQELTSLLLPSIGSIPVPSVKTQQHRKAIYTLFFANLQFFFLRFFCGNKIRQIDIVCLSTRAQSNKIGCFNRTSRLSLIEQVYCLVTICFLFFGEKKCECNNSYLFFLTFHFFCFFCCPARRCSRRSLFCFMFHFFHFFCFLKR